MPASTNEPINAQHGETGIESALSIPVWAPSNLKVPKLQQGSYFPGFLEPRKTSEKALVAVIQEAWIGGVSTRRGDELAQAMGLQGISKSTVSKLCKDIDERVNEFLNRPLTGDWPMSGSTQPT